jgi:DnaK suppressor protein
MICTGVGIAEVPVGERPDDARRVLLERRRELLNEIQSRVRDVREAGSSKDHHTTALAETVEAEPEDDLVFALIQLKVEMLERVNDAVRHLDEGTYGHCVDCGEAIASARLRAMPFAVRCWDCEGAREAEQRRERGQSQRVPSALVERY